MNRKYFTESKIRQGLAGLAFLAVVLPGVLAAQAPELSLGLQDNRIEVDRLAPLLTDGQAVFTIDDVGRIEVDIVATIGAIATRIVAPTGEVIDESTVAGFGGEFFSFEGQAGNDSPILTPAGEPGFHFVYRFPSLGPGPYTVAFSADPALAQEVAVITRLSTDSSVAAALIATESEVVVGREAVLSAAVYDGGQPTAASVVVTMLAPDGTLPTVTLLDDGNGADDAAGDGLFSGVFIPTVAGDHGLVASITGTTQGGLAFVRQAAASFVAVPRSGILTGNFADAGVDDNGDSLFDRVSIEVETEAETAGTYRLFVTLETANGQTLVRTGDADLLVGLGTVTVDFEAEALLALGEDGPYRLAFLDLMLLEANGLVSADKLSDVGQTQAYLLSQLQRPGLALTGNVTDQAFDDDGNGLFDRLVVSVQVDALRSGFYNWSFKLTDPSRNEIDFRSRTAFLPAGLNELVLTFSGLRIGEHGVDGPYLLRDLLMFGAGASLVSTDIGATQPYLASQFEGFSGDDIPPEIAVTVDPSVLWPPKHQLVEVTATVTVTDNVDPNPTVTLVSITSNEGDNALGDGNTTEDIQGAEIGTDDRQFLLRAERSGLGEGRVYTITYEARDASGNTAQTSVTVTVPHDSGK